jgi:DNA-binding NarL/FixJ family response regulator
VKHLRILVADDHALVRRGARDVLHSRHGWRVVGEAANGREAVEKAIALQPDVAVLDLAMPELDGIEAARRIRDALPKSKVLVLTMYECDHMVQRALNAGAHGYLLKSDLSDCLVTAVKNVVEGQRFLTPKVSEIMQAGSFKATRLHPRLDDLAGRITPRERQVIRLLAEGHTNKEVAALLGLSTRTVECHRSRIMLKLHFHSLADLIRYALRNDIAAFEQNHA